MSAARPTIKDVARQAGVSHVTVSRVMNGSAAVVPGTAERVRQAARALGYAPNVLARGLVRGSSRVLGLLASDATSPFVAELVRAVCRAADEAGYVVNICATDFSPERELRALEAFLEHRVAGLVVGPPARAETDARIRELAERGLPIVAVQRQIDHPAINVIAGDSRRGSYEAAMHLLGLGHRRIGYITGSPEVGVGPEKLQGLAEALDTHGLRLDRSLMAKSGLAVEDGYAAAEMLLRRRARPTALMAFSDAVALGAMSAATSIGLRIPEDLSVIGFDDVTYASFTTPPLTTVHQPIVDLGRMAARTLIDAITAAQPPAPVRALLPCGLVVRRSTAPPVALDQDPAAGA